MRLSKNSLGMWASALALVSISLLSSCQKTPGYGRRTAGDPGKRSATTGADFSFDEKDTTQFFVSRNAEQIPGPNLKFIQGGRTVLGSQEEDIMAFRDNLERTVSIASFYMDETEMTNNDYREFLFDMRKRVSADSVLKLEPSENVWSGAMSFNDLYQSYYFRFPGFNFYPVAGVSWTQAKAYATWRTEYVQDLIKKERELDSTMTKNQLIERGVALAEFRLPNEAEWEYAAKAMIGTQYLDENQEYGRIYPWDGRGIRNPYNVKRKGKQGDFLANFKRGRGDYAGISGNQRNDGEILPTNVYDMAPNDFGLYHMAGNMNEWVYDVYRPMTYQDADDLNPLRRDGVYDDEDNYETSLFTDEMRVYKGGSWRDVAYWLAPGTRRFMHQDSATNHIGFRCAMISIGEKGK
ncbi:gliding motility lipoprotein GldJ [Algoriphagus sanaruensis]|uniref:Gliding motility lipoprotein GldJ n=1 Tax=Algoriphagus sanaruensis TaxID=1727163 RepID=A0A142EJV3_9BACT|nr:gliding motility lipoprotein GldJ [Algoriphagus sanaruensis]AMQ55408.1 gliding motility lipoprotein GldJ [Algoriphagus sanaruensis]